MKLVLDILQGLGLASATGLRPFLPALLAGALASGDVGLDFDGTAFAFLESPVWLLILAVALVATVFIRKYAGVAARRGRAGGHRDRPRRAAVRRVDRRPPRHLVVRPDRRRRRRAAGLGGQRARSSPASAQRFAAAGDTQAAAALPWYGEAAGLVVAGASVLFPPLALVAVGFLIALLVTGRRRTDQKYAGLRILR